MRIFARLRELIRENKEVFAFRINWAAMLAFVTFWTYGFFGAVSLGGKTVNAILFVVLTAILFLFLFLWKERHDFFEDAVHIFARDIFVFLTLLFVLFPLSFATLNGSVVNDGFAHAGQAEAHAIAFIQILYAHTGFFGNFIFSNLIGLINLGLLIIGMLCVQFLKNKKFWLSAPFYLIVFVAFRGLIVYLGGSGGPHPPFRLFPLWLSSAIFSPSDMVFRLAQFFGLLFFGLLLYKLAEKRLGFLNSFLLVLSAITIPVLWHVGVLVEQSVWSAIAWSIVLIYLFVESDLTPADYLRLFAIVSIGTLMRQTAFLALIPVALRLAYDVWKKRIALKDVWMSASPMLVMAPFLLHSFISGTAASYVPGSGETLISANASGVSRIMFALRSGIVWTSITNSVQGIWLFFAGLSFIFAFKKLIRIFELCALLVCGIAIFYLVNPALWGIGRYQAEYIIPFAILGLFCAAIFIKEKVYFLRYTLIAGLIILTVCNVYTFKRIPALNLPMSELAGTFTTQIKKPGSYSILSEFPYNYHEALTAVRDAGYAGSLYLDGSTYGTFPHILAGFSVKDVAFAKSLMGGGVRSAVASLSSKDIEKDERIHLVLIADAADGKALARELTQLGWKTWNNFSNAEYGSTIYGYIRKELK